MGTLYPSVEQAGGGPRVVKLSQEALLHSRQTWTLEFGQSGLNSHLCHFTSYEYLKHLT